MERTSKLPPFGTWERPHSHAINEMLVTWGKSPNGLFVRVTHTLPTLIKDEPRLSDHRLSDQYNLLRKYGLSDLIIGETECWGENENKYSDEPHGSCTCD